MSTKIYTGYLWQGTIEEFTEFLNELREKYIEEAVTHLVFSNKWFEEKEKEYKDAGKYFSLSLYLQKQIDTGLNDPDNMEASVVAYFRDGKIAFTTHGLGLFYRDKHRPLQKFITEHSKVKFYGYWNNVDPDENCSDEEWEERELFWDFLDVPSECGLVWELSANPTIWKIVTQYYQKIQENEKK
jgi:hypothetical protein